jgi:hypothetical protein
MGLFDFLTKSGGSKIKVQSYYNESKRELDLPEIKANISSLETGSGSIDFGNYKTNSKITIPKGISNELVKLDQLQKETANAINGLKGEVRQEQLVKYTNTLMEMMQKGSQNEKQPIEKKKEIVNGSDLYDFYKNSNYEIANITSAELNNPGMIIWPVALQDRPTIIHKAQIEIIKSLQKSSWELKILIADCGTINVETKIVKFRKELEKHLKKRNVNYTQIALLSDYYKPDVDGGSILKKFTEISSNLKISELNEYNTKHNSYSSENKQIVEKRFTLKFIQPVLTWSVVIHEAEKYAEKDNGKKTIIVAGKDELKQWKYIFGFSSTIGGIFNDILEDEGNNTIFQEEKPMIFHSENEVIQSLEKGNLAKWLFESFVSTPTFPAELTNLSFCTECKKNPDCRKCLFTTNSESKLPGFFNKERFVENFWEILNPA